MTHDHMTCRTFAELVGDDFDGTLDGATREALDAHAARCAECRALRDDLRRIAGAARALPPLEPARDLWSGIAARIEPPVIAIDRARPAARRMSRWGLAAAAAALVAATSGITYVVTMRAVAGHAVVVAERGATPAPAGPAAPAPAGVPDDVRLAAGQPDAATTTAAATTSPATPRRRAAATAVAYQRPIDRTYDSEIVQLQRIVRDRRSQLDPKTVAILEHNLRIIDQAIAQSRAALARDPASGFLNDQLNSALDQKLALLRTAALLPSRT